MARKRKQPASSTPLEMLEDLAEAGAPEGVLDDELEDVARAEMELMLENLKDCVLLDQLQYLYEHGYTVERLRQLLQGDDS